MRIDLLKNRNFLLLYLGGVISASGATMTSLTLVWLVYTETHSALSISYLGLASVVPTIAFGLLAGALVDKIDRRRLMITSDLVRAAAVAIIPVFYAFRGFNLILIIVAVTIVGVFSTIFRPATNALLPTIVDEGKIQDANGLITASNSMSQMGANAVGGVLIALAGVHLGLAYNSATYLVSALMITLMFTSTLSTNKTSQPPFVAQVKEGLLYIGRTKAILETTITSTFLNLFATMIVPFSVVYVNVFLNASASFYGYFLASIGFGLAVGSLLAGRIRAVKFAGKLFIFASLGFGLATVSLVVVRNAFFAIAIAASLGILLGLLNTTFFSIVQLVVPNEVLGRVLSVDEVGSYAAIPLGQIAAGIMIQSTGIVSTYLLAGVGIIVTAVAGAFLRDLRNLQYRGN
jgi:MFS family permease